MRAEAEPLMRRALAIDGKSDSPEVYRIRADGTAQSTSLPNFKQVGPFSVSLELPDVVLVLTDVNRRFSVSGNIPIMVPRWPNDRLR